MYVLYIEHVFYISNSNPYVKRKLIPARGKLTLSLTVYSGLMRRNLIT